VHGELAAEHRKFIGLAGRFERTSTPILPAPSITAPWM
jgi:hypothetical protein